MRYMDPLIARVGIQEFAYIRYEYAAVGQIPRTKHEIIRYYVIKNNGGKINTREYKIYVNVAEIDGKNDRRIGR